MTWWRESSTLRTRIISKLLCWTKSKALPALQGRSALYSFHHLNHISVRSAKVSPTVFEIDSATTYLLMPGHPSKLHFFQVVLFSMPTLWAYRYSLFHFKPLWIKISSRSLLPQWGSLYPVRTVWNNDSWIDSVRWIVLSDIRALWCRISCCVSVLSSNISLQFSLTLSLFRVLCSKSREQWNSIDCR